VTTLIQLLDVLAESHVEQTAAWQADTLLSEAKCAKGWASLTSQTAVDAERILKANRAQLASALKPGGTVSGLRVRLSRSTTFRIPPRSVLTPANCSAAKIMVG
jgi:hypothetical protein